MKIEVWNEDQKEEEQPLRLRLRGGIDGVALQVVDENGAWIAVLLRIDTEGLLHLYEGVDDNLGLQLNKDGKLKMGKLI